MPRCSIIDCGDPGPVANAAKEGTNYTYNSNVTYICNDGYHSDQYDDYIICTEEGNWTEKPTCIKNEPVTLTVPSIATSTARHSLGTEPVTSVAPSKAPLEARRSLGVGAISGITIGVVVLVVIALVIVLYLSRRRFSCQNLGLRKEKRQNEHYNDNELEERSMPNNYMDTNTYETISDKALNQTSPDVNEYELSDFDVGTVDNIIYEGGPPEEIEPHLGQQISKHQRISETSVDVTNSNNAKYDADREVSIEHDGNPKSGMVINVAYESADDINNDEQTTIAAGSENTIGHDMVDDVDYEYATFDDK
ncbi:uncharacterized protein LOC144448690 [Glandiceps talaboti]